MIIKELYKTRNDGITLYRTYSDEEYKILQVETGLIFEEAVDLETSNFTYVETEEKIYIEKFDEETEENFDGLEVLEDVNIEN